MEQKDEFKTVQVYGRLITEKDPKFDRLFSTSLEDAPVDKSELVLPIFDVVFEDFGKKPETTVREMIQSEIDNSAMENRDMAKLIHETDPSEVVNKPPYGEPKTTAVPVGQIAVSPDHEGLISKFTFGNLANIIDEQSKS